MESRRLGRTDLTVSALGFGCGAVGGLMVRGAPRDQVRAVGMALEAGVTYFDTAPSYGDGRSEENLGRALRELDAGAGAIVGTKVRLAGADLDDVTGAVRRSLEASLGRLGRDSVEVVHLHNRVGEPTTDEPDASLSIGVVVEDVADALRRVVDAGLARHVGFTGIGQTPALHAVLDHPVYETVQAYVNVLNPSALRRGASGGQQDFDGLVAHAAERDAGVIAIRILAAGALSGRGERHPIAGLPPRPLIPGSFYQDDVERARALEAVAGELGLEGTLELAVRFALSDPRIATALIGLSAVEYLESAIRWSNRGPLAERDVARLVGLASGETMPR
jgi:L-galactose dehydrogenase/L-glyceraldehyde 3-phosphate reductase